MTGISPIYFKGGKGAAACDMFTKISKPTLLWLGSRGSNIRKGGFFFCSLWWGCSFFFWWYHHIGFKHRIPLKCKKNHEKLLRKKRGRVTQCNPGIPPEINVGKLSQLGGWGVIPQGRISMGALGTSSESFYIWVRKKWGWWPGHIAWVSWPLPPPPHPHYFFFTTGVAQFGGPEYQSLRKYNSKSSCNSITSLQFAWE